MNEEQWQAIEDQKQRTILLGATRQSDKESTDSGCILAAFLLLVLFQSCSIVGRLEEIRDRLEDISAQLPPAPPEKTK